MEAEQLPGYRGRERTSSDTICDCGVGVCCSFTLLSFLFLTAHSALEIYIPPEQMTQAMFPYIASTCVMLVIWLIYKVFKKLKAN